MLCLSEDVEVCTATTYTVHLIRYAVYFVVNELHIYGISLHQIALNVSKCVKESILHVFDHCLHKLCVEYCTGGYPCRKK